MHWVGLLGFFCLYENKIGSKLIYHKDNKKKIKASKQKCILPWGSAYLWRMLEISKLSALLSHTTYSISPFFKMSETEKKKKKKEKKTFWSTLCGFPFQKWELPFFLWAPYWCVNAICCLFVPHGPSGCWEHGQGCTGPGVLHGHTRAHPSAFPFLAVLAGTQVEISRLGFALLPGWELNGGGESTRPRVWT